MQGPFGLSPTFHACCLLIHILFLQGVQRPSLFDETRLPFFRYKTDTEQNFISTMILIRWTTMFLIFSRLSRDH